MGRENESLHAPLLADESGEEPQTNYESILDATRQVVDGQNDCRSPCQGSCSFTGAVANIAVTAVGAGMLAMPKAYSTVGLLTGLSLTITVCFLTYFSSSVIIRYCARDQKNSYGNLVMSEFGPKGAFFLQCAIITHVIGVMIVYLIIIDDMLIGSAPTFNGIIPYFFGPFDPVNMPWYISRWFTSLALLLTVVAPMLVSRDLSIVSRFSRFSVFMLLSLAATLLFLAGVAVARGKSAEIRVFPDWSSVGGVGGGWGLASAILTVLAVSALAFTCQFNLVPVHNSMEDNRTKTMLSATKGAIGLSALLYASIAVAGYVLFGNATEGDVLRNLTIEFVKGCIGRVSAEVLILFVVSANAINLLVNFVLKVWAVRDAGCELVLGVQASSLHAFGYYSLTAVLVVIAYAVSVVLPSVWFLVSLVGSTACVTFSYVFPGLLLVKRAETRGGRVLGGGAVALAALMAATAIINTLTGNADV